MNNLSDTDSELSPPQPVRSARQRTRLGRRWHALPNWGKAIVILIVATIGWGSFAASSSKSAVDSTSSSPSYTPSYVAPHSTTHTVTYKTAGTARYGSITYETPTGTGQQSDVDIPLTRKTDTTPMGISFTGFSKGAFVYLSVQNGQESGTVECTIEVDGVVISHNSAQGGFAIATCKGEA